MKLFDREINIPHTPANSEMRKYTPGSLPGFINFSLRVVFVGKLRLITFRRFVSE